MISQVGTFTIVSIITLVFSLAGVPAILPLFRDYWKHPTRNFTFSVATVLTLFVVFSIVLGIHCGGIVGDERIAYAVSCMIVATFWWLVIVRVTSNPLLMSRLERLLLLAIAIPIVFVGAVFALGNLVVLGFFLLLNLPPTDISSPNLFRFLGWLLFVVIINRWCHNKVMLASHKREKLIRVGEN